VILKGRCAYITGILSCTLPLRCQRNGTKLEKTSLSTNVVRRALQYFYDICTTYVLEDENLQSILE
jgi:hypothetical protein